MICTIIYLLKNVIQPSPVTSNNTDQDEGLDEFDLYPGTLELPQLRSPRGSLCNSNYGSRQE